MSPPVHKFVAIACLTAVLAACSSPSVPTPAQAPAAAADVPVVQDESALRQAAAAALDAQRIYTPAGDSAIEHYLALRRLRPGDTSLATALLELLPYALIASEQALGRGDLAEARRLVALIEQVDPQAPALARLRDGIAAAETESSRRIVAAAEAAKRQELLAAQVAAQTAAAQATPRATPAPAAASAPAPAPAAPELAAATSAALAPAPPAPAVQAPPPGQAKSAAVATATPRLLSAPSPRYPLSALRRKIEGSVTVEFTVQPDGSVSSPRVLSADPAGLFDDAALAAAARWRFERIPAAVTTARIVQFKLAVPDR